MRDRPSQDHLLRKVVEIVGMKFQRILMRYIHMEEIVVDCTFHMTSMTTAWHTRHTHTVGAVASLSFDDERKLFEAISEARHVGLH